MLTSGEGPFTLVFDIDEFKPACALLQALYDATPMIAAEFDSRTWLTHPTPGMRRFTGISKEQMETLVTRVHEKLLKGTERDKNSGGSSDAADRDAQAQQGRDPGLHK